MEPLKEPRVVIAGAGPAGMVLAYQLVTNGVPVRVLEQHPNFEREFRGELLGPSVLPALEQLGILPLLVERGLARRGITRQMFVGSTRKVTLPGGPSSARAYRSQACSRCCTSSVTDTLITSSTFGPPPSGWCARGTA